MKWNKLNTISALVLIVVVIFILVSLFLPYDCKSDKTCFDKKAAYCRPASYNYNSDGNLFEYRVLGSSSDNCVINIKLTKVSSISTQSIKNSFEGKSMKCLFTKSQLQIAPVQETSGLLNYCSGTLKEATLELMIQKLYGTIAQNLGGIINQVSKNQTINTLTNPDVISNGTVSN
jgi:hypothetical protein